MRTIKREESVDYHCQYDWEDHVSIQGDDLGVVFTSENVYATAFFEAFPKGIDDYFRGEGKTMEEAEKKAWEKYQKVLNCPKHEFEKRGYTSGIGFCKHCNMQKENAFEPEHCCEICKIPTNWCQSKVKKWYCKEHKHLIPEEEKTAFQKGEIKDPFQLIAEMMKKGES